MKGLTKYFCLWVFATILLSAKTVTAHDYSEYSFQLPSKQQMEILILLEEVIKEVKTPPAPAKDDSKELASYVFERAQLLQPEGTILLINKLEQSSLNDVFQPTPYAYYLESLGQLLYEFESSHDHHHIDKDVEAKLKLIEKEIDQWLK